MKTDSFDFTAVVDDQHHADWIDIDTMSQSPTRADTDHRGDIRSSTQIEIKHAPCHDISQKLQFELTTDWA